MEQSDLTKISLFTWRLLNCISTKDNLISRRMDNLALPLHVAKRNLNDSINHLFILLSCLWKFMVGSFFLVSVMPHNCFCHAV
jgi:hypothetical protein